jgi:mono/diheme cytochrome c family protein
MRFLLGLVVGVLLVLAGEYLFLTQGGMPVAARNARPLPLERLLTSRALHVALVKEADRPAPIPADEANLVAGAKVYREHCALCHGGPGEAHRSELAAGMFPRPPKLMPPGKGVTDDPVGETYWKVRNGIRLTGMPAFEGTLSDTALWQVSLLLLKADELPAPVGAELRATSRPER